MSELERVGTFALVLVLALLSALWSAFLVPLRVAGVPVPLAVVVACVANLVLGRAGGRLYGKPGALVPGLLWFAVVAVLQGKRPEGDLVVTGGATGLLLLLLGSTCAAVPVASARAVRAARPVPEPAAGRPAPLSGSPGPPGAPPSPSTSPPSEPPAVPPRGP